MDKTFEAPKSRFLPTLVVFVFVLTVLYSLFLFFERVSLSSSIKSIQSQKAEVQSKIDVLKKDQIAELYNAQKIKNAVSGVAVSWSKVISNLNSFVPVGVFVSSYSASENGNIQINGVADSFASVSDFISALSDSSEFGSVFVPSVNMGVTSDGQDVVSFSLNASNLSK